MFDPKQEGSAARSPTTEDFMLLSHLPLLMMCDWWTMALQSFCHDCGPQRAAGSAEDDGQLVIPEALEVEGEHVFA